jgi:hypothetical protein
VTTTFIAKNSALVFSSGAVMVKKDKVSQIVTVKPKRIRIFNGKVLGPLVKIYNDIESDKIAATKY